ncbi:MAG: hypothetical protein WCI36_00265 [bacterium]
MLQKIKKQKKYIDLAVGKKRPEVVSFLTATKKDSSTLFSRGKKTNSFFTEDSKLYITPREQRLMQKGVKLDRRFNKWDSLSSKVVNDFVWQRQSETSLLLEALERRYEKFNDASGEMTRSFLGQFSTARLWNASIIGSILFGMVMMTFVYRYLGQGASAKQIDAGVAVEQQIAPQAALVADTKDDAESFAKQVMDIEKAQSKESLEVEIREMVKGYPIEKMVPYIAQQDRTVAAFIVAIARKESGWGQHVPVLNGQDCYNYWGYRGQRKLMGTGGHTCFNSPKDAVETIGKRINTLVNENGKDTPSKMVIWKCGSSCSATGGQAAANKWVKDVNGIFEEFTKKN